MQQIAATCTFDTTWRFFPTSFSFLSFADKPPQKQAEFWISIARSVVVVVVAAAAVLPLLAPLLVVVVVAGA